METLKFDIIWKDDQSGLLVSTVSSMATWLKPKWPVLVPNPTYNISSGLYSTKNLPSLPFTGL
jgi:hypothetical protein